MIGNAGTDVLTVNGETVFTRVTATISSNAVSITPGNGGTYFEIPVHTNPIALTLVTTNAVEGQVIYIRNLDDVDTTNVVIAATTTATFQYDGTAWAEVSAMSLTRANALGITSVGTILSGVWSGTALLDAKVADDLTINGGSINNSPVGASSANSGKFTTLGATGVFTVGAGGNEFTISESSDDITLEALVQDKDMIFKVNDGGSATTAMRLDGASASVVIASGKLNYASTVVTATGAELNYLDITTLGTSEASKAVTADGSGDVVLSANLNANGDTVIGNAGTDVLTVTGKTVYAPVTPSAATSITLQPGTGGGTYFEIADTSSSSAVDLSLGTASVIHGQIIYVRNKDAQDTTTTVIPAGKTVMYIFDGASWKMVEDTTARRRRLLNDEDHVRVGDYSALEATVSKLERLMDGQSKAFESERRELKQVMFYCTIVGMAMFLVIVALVVRLLRSSKDQASKLVVEACGSASPATRAPLVDINPVKRANLYE